MTTRTRYLVMLTLVSLSTVTNSGCFWLTTQGPTLGIFSIPIPVSPYFQDKEEDEFWWNERYDRVPILDPIPPGGPAIAMDEPTDDEIMLALERARPVEGGLPMLHEVQRNNVRIVKELIADYLDEPRVYPLIGPAQMHHAHYKCTVYFTEVTRVGWPIPYTTIDQDTREVLYIDHNHLHRVVPPDESVGPVY